MGRADNRRVICKPENVHSKKMNRSRNFIEMELRINSYELQISCSFSITT